MSRSSCPNRQQERWTIIPSAPRYDISTLARVRDSESGRLLRPTVSARVSTRTAYLTVSLVCRDGQRRNYYLHRAMIEAWVGPIPDGAMVLHANDDSSDNSLANLRIGTPKQNADDLRRNRGRERPADEVSAERAAGFARVRADIEAELAAFGGSGPPRPNAAARASCSPAPLAAPPSSASAAAPPHGPAALTPAGPTSTAPAPASSARLSLRT